MNGDENEWVADPRIIRLQQLILSLGRATGPARNLDEEIARFKGWREYSLSHGARTRWENPTGAVGDTPRYTLNLDVALELLKEAEPSWVGGFSWEPGMGSAAVGSNPVLQGASPVIAICMQALLLELRKLQESHLFAVSDR